MAETKGFIYLILNILDGHFYIGRGATGTISRRWAEHLRGWRSSPRLQEALSRDGADAFTVWVLACPPRKEVEEAEHQLLQRFVGHPLCYNIKCKGLWHHSPVARAKMSATRIGLRPSTETRARMSATRKGVPKTPQMRAKLSAALKGRTKSDTTKTKLRAIQLAWWAEHPEARAALAERNRRA